ncbi:hypothetical protein HMPREF9151_00551 [Hoylesella saccharolytica F0055]|uniref:Uncharacterized protein n=1 Tax=Hoylesella saccharolytica F0055 TaxID=1127699 RepID=L1NIE1_9BACT|nr:hypothetical protein HMPREF9151_00551 [Hoylesella saccharolytica F0055]
MWGIGCCFIEEMLYPFITVSTSFIFPSFLWRLYLFTLSLFLLYHP